MFTSLIERLGSGAVDCERAAGSMREVRCWCEVSKEPRSRMCEEHRETVSIFLFKIQIVVEGYKYTIRSENVYHVSAVHAPPPTALSLRVEHLVQAMCSV